MSAQQESCREAMPAAELAVGRVEAARHLLQSRQVRDSLALTRQPSLRNSTLAGLQAAIAVAVALPLFHLSPWPHLIGFASLGALVALFGRFAPERSRSRIVFVCGLLQTLAVLFMSTAAWLGASVAILLALLALACGLFYFIAVTGHFGAPGPLIFVFAAGASMGPVGSLREVAERAAATAAVAALAWAICALSEGLRHPATDMRPLPTEPLRPVGHRLTAALRIAGGAAIAVYASHVLGADHPAWAAMGTLAVMQGAHLHINMNRALQRMAGTVIGALLAWLILVHEPSTWTVIAALFVLQFGTEAIIGSNYGLGQILVTPMALLMSYLAAPRLSGAAMAPERILDTLLGVSIGIAMAVLLSTIDDRRHLANHRASPTTG
ncbi:FUSC family protein [Rhizobiaceae bacterium n13]|uniref:FUSC family protein n=1 Tax=Ferirhizobium litorale TaxID=2927786 RepID=A0AAE3QK89_9HYPH|nr:FUSC family protein [Fererhizobium litorale]MDI7864905.1 FUSC family protein [Fererhizobium litorale]MDI7925025.1 FUSC family protein [Fererhizobium litorale]